MILPLFLTEGDVPPLLLELSGGDVIELDAAAVVGVADEEEDVTEDEDFGIFGMVYFVFNEPPELICDNKSAVVVEEVGGAIDLFLVIMVFRPELPPLIVYFCFC